LYHIQEEANNLRNPRIRHIIDATIHHAEVQARSAGQTDKDAVAEVRDALMVESERCKRPLVKRAARAAASPPAPLESVQVAGGEANCS